jgi:phytoene synthase
MTANKSVIKKHGKTFFWSSLFLDKKIANRIYAVYQFCRELDDLVDDKEAKNHQQFKKIYRAWQADQYHTGFDAFKTMDPKYLPNAEVMSEFLIGQLSDINYRQPISLSALLKYCYRVAGTVGLMVCDVIGIKDKKLRYHAIDLGIAMQLTNICRDILEDAQQGRSYLPKNMLEGIGTQNIMSPNDYQRKRINEVRDKLLQLANEYYESGKLGIQFLPGKTQRSIRIAAKLYKGIGDKIRSKKISYDQGRIYLNIFEKLYESIFLLKNQKPYKRNLIHNQLLHHSIKNLPGAHQA